MAGSPASRLECLMIWGGADVVIIGIKCTINAMCLNHPETILLPLVREIIVFHKTCPRCQKGWGLLLWDEGYQFTRQTWMSLVFRCRDLCQRGTLLSTRPTPCSLLGSGDSWVSAESLSPVQLFVTPVTPARLLCPWHVPDKNTGVGCHFLLPGIFPTRGSNPRLLCPLHWQANSQLLDRQGSPMNSFL